MNYLIAMLNGNFSPHPEDNPQVQQEVARFIEVKGFHAMWKELIRDYASLQELMNALKHRTVETSAETTSDLSAQERANVERAIEVLIRSIKERVGLTIDELFTKAGYHPRM
jgi:hypothetical protein